MNPVSLLNEYMAQRHLPLPNYSFSETICNINPVKFICSLEIDKMKIQATGLTKKSAKQECASLALKKLNALNRAEATIEKISTQQPLLLNKNHIGLLNEYASKNGLSLPIYSNTLRDFSGLFVCTCTFLNFETEGIASNKKDAKQIAAQKMLEKLDNVDPVTMQSQTFSVKRRTIDNYDVQQVTEKYLSLSLDNNSNITKLADKNKEIEIAAPLIAKHQNASSLPDLYKKLNNLQMPYNVHVMQEDPFIVVLKITGKSYVFMGFGDTKDLAMCDVIEMVFRILTDGSTLLS